MLTRARFELDVALIWSSIGVVASSDSSGRVILSSTSCAVALEYGTSTDKNGAAAPPGISSSGMLSTAIRPSTITLRKIISIVIGRLRAVWTTALSRRCCWVDMSGLVVVGGLGLGLGRVERAGRL